LAARDAPLRSVFGELFRDDVAGPLLGKPELGMGVDVAADLSASSSR
jgi:hypothetical protein